MGTRRIEGRVICQRAAKAATDLNGELNIELSDVLHGADHLIVALSLLSELGHVDILLTLTHSDALLSLIMKVE